MSSPCILVSAGPSREHLDDVRYLSNGSSGRMGVAVAAAAAHRGWAVHLALGPTDIEAPAGVHLHRFLSARDLDAIARNVWDEVDAFVATAAVCDYRPRDRTDGKRKKTPGDWDVKFVRNPDVLAERGREKGDRLLVGFALEPTLDLAEARRKLVEKNLDLVLLNTVANLGVSAGGYRWIESDGTSRHYDEVAKDELAEAIVEWLAGRLVV